MPDNNLGFDTAALRRWPLAKSCGPMTAESAIFGEQFGEVDFAHGHV